MLFDRLAGKRLVWTRRVRIYCDNGHPKFRWVPQFLQSGYAPYWKLRGFKMYWLGREFNFCFGKDVKGLYE